MILKPYENVVTAWAAPASGPGWANSPVCVLIYEQTTGQHRVEWLQPDEQSDELHTLYAVSATVSEQMRRAAARLLAERREVRRLARLCPPAKGDE